MPDNPYMVSFVLSACFKTHKPKVFLGPFLFFVKVLAFFRKTFGLCFKKKWEKNKPVQTV